MLFYGTYTHSVDPAGRFIMPKTFRNRLGNDFLITKGINCLWCFPEDYLVKTIAPAIEKLGRNPIRGLFDTDVVRWTRHLFADMVATNDDSQNRVPLTQEHRQYAGIRDTVVLCGRGQIIEIWSPEALEQYRQANADIAGVIASAETLRPVVSQLLKEDADADVPQAGTEE
jgi:MraZ protein